MTNPFEDTDARYHVLVNDEGQYSLWPVFVEVPQGWRAVLEDATRSDAVAWVEDNWDDPTTLGVAAGA